MRCKQPEISHLELGPCIALTETPTKSIVPSSPVKGYASPCHILKPPNREYNIGDLKITAVQYSRHPGRIRKNAPRYRYPTLNQRGFDRPTLIVIFADTHPTCFK